MIVHFVPPFFKAYIKERLFCTQKTTDNQPNKQLSSVVSIV